MSDSSGDHNSSSRLPNQSEPVQPPPAAKTEQQKIAQTSPEGVPGSPNVGGKAVGATITVLGVLTLVIALLVAAFVNRWAGLAVGAFGIGLLFFNPTLWSAVLRAKERES